MSDIVQDPEDFVDESLDATDEIGLTSEETSADSSEKKSMFASMTVFDAMLLIALICVTLATLKLFLELRMFGDFPFEFPWRTNEITLQ